MSYRDIVIYNPFKDSVNNTILKTRITYKDYSEQEKRYEVAQLLKENVKVHKGVGLAANQIGIDERAFIANNIVCFNPEVLEYSEETVGSTEGCLSLPNVKGRVNRHNWVRVRYTFEDGSVVKEKLEGFDAIIFQHELDHLNGVLFPDRIEGKFAHKKFWEKYKKSRK